MYFPNIFKVKLQFKKKEQIIYMHFIFLKMFLICSSYRIQEFKGSISMFNSIH